MNDRARSIVEADPASSPSPLLTAGQLLAERGVYGLVWFGDDFVVEARYGRMASFIEVGEPLLEQCLPLIGLDDEIRALKQVPGAVIDLPAVLIATQDNSLPRLNMTVFWYAEGKQFVMLLARATSRSDVEVELSKHMRARLIAEAEVAEKSRELTRANAELARANRDLEDFAAIISHDLKSPLRALRYATDDLAQSVDAGDIDAARARIAEIGERTMRISGMMTSLLDYASVGRKSVIAESVETRQVVEDVVRSLAVPPGFQIEIAGTWPALNTVRAALDLVLRNLVQNAIVHHDRDHGQIRIDARDERKSVVISITDDGPGIDPAFHEAILLPFRTVNQKSGSTGMGLAFVNRTIETIGGRLQIKSDPAQKRGTTFRLTWPKVVKG